MKPQDVVVGMGVVLASDASRTGTVLKRDGARVRVDFGDKTQWKAAAELEPSGASAPAPAAVPAPAAPAAAVPAAAAPAPAAAAAAASAPAPAVSPDDLSHQSSAEAIAMLKRRGYDVQGHSPGSPLSRSVGSAVPALSWTVPEVAAWASTLGLDAASASEFAAALTENEIDGAALLALTAEEIKDDLEVKKLGPRKKVLAGIEELRAAVPGDTAEVGEPPEGDPDPGENGGSDEELEAGPETPLASAKVLKDEWLPGGADGALLSAAEAGDMGKARQAGADGASLDAMDSERGFHALLWAAEMGQLEMAVYLIEEGVAVDAPARDGVKATKFGGSTALMRAAVKGHTSLVEALLDRGADMRLEKASGGNALGAASAGGHMEIILALLDRGAEVDCVSSGGATALLNAAGAGHTDAVITLAERSADLNQQHRITGQSPLIFAALRGHNAVVTALCDRSADLNLQNTQGATALIRAAAGGHGEIVATLCDRSADLNLQDKVGATALMSAAEDGHGEIVATLCDRSADLNLQNKAGATALMWAAGGGHSEIVATLCDRSADLNLQNETGATALMWAAEGGHSEIVATLCDRSADLNLQNETGATALMWAAGGGHSEIVATLCDRSADLNLQDKAGATALMWAAEGGHSEIVATLCDRSADLNLQCKAGATALMRVAGRQPPAENIFVELMSRGADFTLTNKTGAAALHWAARAGFEAGIALLLEGNVGVDICDSHDQTPLYLAAYSGHHSTVVKLAQHGADINSQMTTGATPLMAASSFGRAAVVKWLCARGAELNVQDPAGGFTALMAAADCMSGQKSNWPEGVTKQDFLECVQILLEAGANKILVNSAGDTALTLGAHDEEIAECIISSIEHDMITGALAAPDDAEPEPEPEPEGPRSFANSHFKKAYDSQTAPIEMATVVFAKLNEFLVTYCSVHRLQSKAELTLRRTFVKNLQRETMEHAGVEVHGEAGPTAELLWTSGQKFEGVEGHEKELCSLINSAIRDDHPDLAGPTAGICRAINTLCVVRGLAVDQLLFPKDGITYRGGGFDNAHKGFFTEGKQFRVPGFLATSFSKKVAKNFRDKIATPPPGGSRILWLIRIDPEGETDPVKRCKHVNFVSNSHIVDADGNPREAEFLFAPYSTFTIKSVKWGDGGEPHVIKIEAATDNSTEPEDLPLSPWY
jgi:ankyrin repeat protein